MSSSWTERQGQVGDLRDKSREELVELLSRQEKLLSNKRFINTLPDRGRKISEFAERVRLALAHHDEDPSLPDSLASVRSELQSRYRQALAQRPSAVQSQPQTPLQGGQGEDVAPRSVTRASPHGQESAVKHLGNAVFSGNAVFMETGPAGDAVAAPQTSDRMRESDLAEASDLAGATESQLAEALQRVTLSDPGSAASPEHRASHSSSATNTPVSERPGQKKPHYMEVLERTERNQGPEKLKFKPNQLRAPQADVPPPGSASPSRSPGSPSTSPLSAEARRERDRKHLDDITSARLPPLHHRPAQLLTLDQSAALLREQTNRELELQAKLAAQKLAEGLRISMRSSSPEERGGPLAPGAYREVHDHGAALSSDED